MQTQVYVDETKARGYVVAAACVPTAAADSMRRALRDLLPRGQRRLHMVNEATPLRRKILGVLTDHRAEVDLFAAGQHYRTNIERRRACLERLVMEIPADCTMLTLESDETQDRRDRHDLAQYTRRHGRSTLLYRHESPYAETLLWVPDAVGWAHARGGEWRRLADPVVRRIVDV